MNLKAKTGSEVAATITLENLLEKRWVPLEEAQKENKRIYEEGVNTLFDKQLEIQELKAKITETNKILDEKCNKSLHCPWTCKTGLREVLK